MNDSELKQWEMLVERIECGMTTEKDAQLVRDILEELLDLRETLSKVGLSYNKDEQ